MPAFELDRLPAVRKQAVFNGELFAWHLVSINLEIDGRLCDMINEMALDDFAVNFVDILRSG